MMLVRDVMKEDVPFVRGSDFITRVRSIMRENNLRTLPVVGDDMRLEGVILDRDVLRVTSTKSNVTVAGYIQVCPLVTPEMDVREAARLMLDGEMGRTAVVTSRGSPVLKGMLDIKDIFARIEVEEIPPRPVSDFMTPRVVTCSPGDRVSMVWSRMNQLGYSGFPVVRNDSLVGMVTRSDIIRAGYARLELEADHGRTASMSPRVERVMSTPPYMLPPGATVREAAGILLRLDVGRLCIANANGERLVGILDRYDLVRAWLGG